MSAAETKGNTRTRTRARSVLVTAVLAMGLALAQCGGDQQGAGVPLVSTPTEASGAVVQVDAGNFDAVVLKGEKPCLVEFYATWCSYCQRMEPTVARIATSYAGRVVVGKIDVDTQQGLVGRWGVRAWPTFVLFRNGTEVGRHVGMATEAELAALLDGALTGS
jgi:thioredoxin 1